MHKTIASLEDFGACLRSDNLKIKLSALQAVYKQMTQPDRKHQKLNIGFVDLLYERYELAFEKEERLWCACILMQINDSRKFDLAEREFFSDNDNAVLLLCANTMAALPASEKVVKFSSVVMGDNKIIRLRLAANLLSDCLPLLEPDVALRVSIFSDHALPLPEVTDETCGFWLKELSGPYRWNARRLLQARGGASIHYLLINWQKLPVDVATWVLEQAVRRDITITGNIALEIIQSAREPALLRHALQTLKQFDITEADERLIAALYAHEDNSVRAAALEIGTEELSWREWLETDVPDYIRLAVLNRIRRNKQKKSIPYLDPLLLDSNWKIRAGATEALVAMAPDSLEILNAHLSSDHIEAKISALHALQRLEKKECLSQRVV